MSPVPDRTIAIPDLSLSAQWRGDALHLYRTAADAPATPRARHLLFLSDHGGPDVLWSWTQSRFGGHGLWGCIELAQRGWHVVMPRLPRFARGRLLKHLGADLPAAWGLGRQLQRDDVVYCVHNLLWWVPLLAKLGALKCRVVTLLFAKEPLPFAGAHHGILGMTKTAVDHARRLNPGAKVLHLPWGVELTPHQHRALPYEPRWGLSTGVTHRDFGVIQRAFADIHTPLRLCARGRAFDAMPPSVQVEHRFLTPEALVNEFYAGAAYVLITLPADPDEREALGCKSMLESMALARPIIKTRGGSMDGDLDVEREGVGLYIPPGDAPALRAAVARIHADPAAAAAMGRRGRALCESTYHMTRFGHDLHTFLTNL